MNNNNDRISLTILKLILRIDFIIVTTVYIAFTRFELGFVKLFPFAGYIPYYALIFGQLPAIGILIAVSIHRRLHNLLVWYFFRTEFWMLVVSIIAFILYFYRAETVQT
jgi:hypothetical protein